jgi:hypothetical protein
LKKSLTFGRDDVNVNAIKIVLGKLVIKSYTYVSNESGYFACKNL